MCSLLLLVDIEIYWLDMLGRLVDEGTYDELLASQNNDTSYVTFKELVMQTTATSTTTPSNNNTAAVPGGPPTAPSLRHGISRQGVSDMAHGGSVAENVLDTHRALQAFTQELSTRAMNESILSRKSSGNENSRIGRGNNTSFIVL